MSADAAAEYTDAGGRIALLAACAADGQAQVRITVRDSGRGIHAAQLPHVFDRFTPVSQRIGREQAGIGVGLALVKQLVEMHGGSGSARSPGEGLGCGVELLLPTAAAAAASGLPAAATATVRSLPPTSPAAPIPVPAVAVAAAPSVAAAGLLQRAACRVLVAEDNRDSADSMAVLLQLMGYETAIARDGPQAVASAQSFRPQVVLMDIGLPGIDGYEAARRIRAQPWGHGMRLVALTGWGLEADRERSRQAGLDHHLVKPVDPHYLERLLQELAGR